MGKYVFEGGDLKGKSFGVSIKRLTDWGLVLDSARFTIRKDDVEKEPSEKFKGAILLSEHSPIRCLHYMVELQDVPYWASQHIARHDAFAGHYMRDGAQDTHFVATSRTDRVGVNRNKLPQDAPVGHRIWLDAQDFITISTRRLCNMASYETRTIWRAIINELKAIDPILASKCVPMCVYRGFCPEISPCGHDKTKKFEDELREYRSRL